MEQIAIPGAKLFYDAMDRDAAERIGPAVGQALRLAQDRWRLSPRGELHVHVMSSWPKFLFRAAPWTWRPLLVATFPLWAPRVKRIWKLAGGWTQRFGGRLAVGVKPPRLLLAADRSLGERLFLSEPDVQGKVRQITWHETVHACSLHHKLPAWLNEGLAMFAVDRLAGKPTVRPETLSWMKVGQSAASGRRYPTHSHDRVEAFLRLYTQGYWRVRFSEEACPGLLKALFGEKHRPGEWLRLIAGACGLSETRDWAELDMAVVRHFESQISLDGKRKEKC